jgi:hypothetical protein
MPGTGIEGRACFDNLPRVSILVISPLQYY